MKYDSVNLVYFSPTNTTAKILDAIAEGYQAEKVNRVNLTPADNRTVGEIPLYEGLTILGAPVYAGRLPITVIEAFNRMKSDGKPAVVVVLYGNREYEDALLELKDIAKNAGLVPVAGGAFVGEHSYSSDEHPIAMGRPDSEDITTAKNFGQELKRRIEDAANLGGIGELLVPGNSPYKERKRMPPLSPRTDHDGCTLCMTCANACPTEAITVDSQIETNAKNCIVCCACVKVCPESVRIMDHPGIVEKAVWLSENYAARKEPVLFLAW